MDSGENRLFRQNARRMRPDAARPRRACRRGSYSPQVRTAVESSDLDSNDAARRTVCIVKAFQM